MSDMHMTTIRGGASPDVKIIGGGVSVATPGDEQTRRQHAGDPEATFMIVLVHEHASDGHQCQELALMTGQMAAVLYGQLTAILESGDLPVHQADQFRARAREVGGDYRKARDNG